MSSFLLQTNHCSQSFLLVVLSVAWMVPSVCAQTKRIIGNVNTVTDHWCNFIHTVVVMCCTEVKLWLGRNFWPLEPITITWEWEIDVSSSVLTLLCPCENVMSPTVLGDLTLQCHPQCTVWTQTLPALIHHMILDAFHGSTIIEPLCPAQWIEFQPLHHWRVKLLPFPQTVDQTKHKLTKLWCWWLCFSGMLYAVYVGWLVVGYWHFGTTCCSLTWGVKQSNIALWLLDPCRWNWHVNPKCQ